jgi:predicted dehydrogenase
MIYLVGQIATVQVLSFRRVLDVPLDDTTSILMRFKEKMSGYVCCIQATASMQRLQVFGSKGWAELRGENELVVGLIDNQPKARTFPGVNKERLELEAFANAVARGSGFPIPYDEVVNGVAAFEAIGKSARSGQLLKLR